MPHAQGLTRYCLYVLLIFTPLARGSVQGWAICIVHLVTLVALCFFLLEKGLPGHWKWTSTPLDKPILAVLLLCLLSSLFSTHPRTSLWAAILLINYLTVYYLVIHTTRTRSQLRHLVFFIIGVATFVSIFGLFERFGANPFPWWNYPDLPENVYRLSSTFGNPDHLAGYMEMAIPVVLGLLLLGYRPETVSFLVYLSLLSLTASALSLSRGGWISLLLGLSFMASALLASRYFQRKKLLLALIAGFFAAAIIVAASTPVAERIRTLEQKQEAPSFRSRVHVWGRVLDMIGDYPLLGTGPGTFATVFTQYQPPGLTSHFTMAHNDYLHFTSELGLPLIAIIIWMIVAIYRKGFNKLGNSSRLVRATTLGALSGITAMLFHSVVDFNLHIPANALLFAVLAAIVSAPLPVHHIK